MHCGSIAESAIAASDGSYGKSYIKDSSCLLFSTQIIDLCNPKQHDTLPSFAKESLSSFVLYYAGTLQVLMDAKTRRPVPFTRPIFVAKTKRFLTAFMQTSLLYSLLMPFDYSVAPRRDIRSVVDLFHWGNLVNAYLMALLTSVILEGKDPLFLIGMLSPCLLISTCIVATSRRSHWIGYSHISLYWNDDAELFRVAHDPIFQPL
jgi:hypothetical protein